MMFTVTIETKRFLRKPKIETFTGDWKSEEQVRHLVCRFRPTSRILNIVEVQKNEKI